MKVTEIITIISSILGSGILSVFGTHILYSNKLKKEINHKGKEIIAKKIQEALCEIRDMELLIKSQEIYDVENILETRGDDVNMIEGEIIYPEIMNDWETFDGFHDNILEKRKDYEKYLSCKVALNLVFIDRYIHQLRLFLKDHGDEAFLPLWGTIFIFDLQRWQQRMDRILIKEINKHTYKLESHETKKWKHLRKKELIKQYENTILYYLKENKCSRRNKRKMEIIKNTLLELGLIKEN